VLTLSEVRGQARVVDLLQRALQSERLAQAYLFAGPKGCGKHTTGLALAKALNCQSAPGVGCHECDSCIKIDEGNHPDVRTLEPEGKQHRIPIDTIRKQVIPSLAMPPHEGKARVFLIEEAASMQGPAANALLKTLEEPPPRTHFILGTVAPIQLLPTIRSQCQRVNFQALSADLAASMRGEDEEADTIRNLAEAIMRVTDERGLEGILDLAKDSGERLILLGALKQCAQYCHLAARSAAQADDLNLAQAHGRRAAKVLETLVAVRDHNAHGQLAVEHLLVAMRSLPLPQNAGANA
jgi:DNA polymerase III delta' subunit